MLPPSVTHIIDSQIERLDINGEHRLDAFRDLLSLETLRRPKQAWNQFRQNWNDYDLRLKGPGMDQTIAEYRVTDTGEVEVLSASNVEVWLRMPGGSQDDNFHHVTTVSADDITRGLNNGAAHFAEHRDALESANITLLDTLTMNTEIALNSSLEDALSWYNLGKTFEGAINSLVGKGTELLGQLQNNATEYNNGTAITEPAYTP